MKGVGGGNEYSMKTSKSWCSNCRRISAILMFPTPTLHSSSSSSSTSSFWKGGNSLLKIAVTLAMVVLLFSIYQNCAPHESSLPVWLSLSFVSRPSFILSSKELSQESQERPASRLVEPLEPMRLDHPDFSTLPPGDVSPFSAGEETEPSDDQTVDEDTEKRDNFDAHNGSLSGLQRRSGATNVDSSAAEKDLPQDPVRTSLHGTRASDGEDLLVDPVKDIEDILPGFNSSDLSSPSSVNKDGLQESETVVLSEVTTLEVKSNSSLSSSSSSLEKDQSQSMEVAETTSMESAKSDHLNDNEGKTLEEGGKESQQLEEILSSNSSVETKPEADGKETQQLEVPLSSNSPGEMKPGTDGKENKQLEGILSSNSSVETKPEADGKENQQLEVPLSSNSPAEMKPGTDGKENQQLEGILSSNSSVETKPEGDGSENQQLEVPLSSSSSVETKPEADGKENQQLEGILSSNSSVETKPEGDGSENQQLEVPLSSNSFVETKPEADGKENQQLEVPLSSNSSVDTKAEADGKENQQLEVLLSSNSSVETKSGADGATPSEEGQQHAANDDVIAAAPILPVGESEPSQAANTDSSVETQSDITEKPMDDRRVQVEQQLHAARQAIDGATLADSDRRLHGVIYNNVSAFSKSYELMEEMFKIYVYKDGEPPLVHVGPSLGIYASEGKFLEQISKGSSFIVEDPELAHMYYLPYSVAQMVLNIYVEGSHSMQPLNDFVKDYVDQVAAKYPFWNRHHGADHFFLACHDWGPATARDHDELRKNAMKVVCNADVSETYVLGKDASLPEIYLHDYKPVKVGGPGAARRKFLAFFAGQKMHGHVRPVLLEHWKDKDPDMKIYEVLPKDVERKMNYVEHMKNSKYCLCAAGFEVNSPRIVESIYYECVPVIIADNFALPFSDVLNWSTFSVTIPESDIPNLKTILLNISDRKYNAMQKRLSKVRRHFIWNDEPVKYDVFHMIMHSVWMSRLNRLDL
ncbi:unnamed protein product [Calypogeia fissa]